MRQIYGHEGLAFVENELAKLKTAMEKHDIPSDIVFVDEKTEIGGEH